MVNMALGVSTANAPSLAVVGFKKEIVNVTSLLQHTVVNHAVVHHRRQELAIPRNVQVMQIDASSCVQLKYKRF